MVIPNFIMHRENALIEAQDQIKRKQPVHTAYVIKAIQEAKEAYLQEKELRRATGNYNYWGTLGINAYALAKLTQNPELKQHAQDLAKTLGTHTTPENTLTQLT